MRRLIRGWKRLGYDEKFRSKIVNYADDLVIRCPNGYAGQAATAMRHLMSLLKLTVNEEKTRTCRLPEERFDFLGYTFSRQYSFKRQTFYIGTKPPKKSIKRLMESIGELTGRSSQWMTAEDLVGTINRKPRGWANYFKLGPVSRTFGSIERYTVLRLRRWLCGKHKVAGNGAKRYPIEAMFGKYGLMRLSKIPRTFSWAKA